MDRDWRRPMAARPEGYRLLLKAERGDALVLANFQILGPRTTDAADVLRRCQRIGLTVHLAGGTEQESGPVPLSLLGALADLDRGTQSASIRAGMARLRSEGRRRSRYPPLGHKFVWKRGGFVAELDPREMKVIRKIVQWKDAGWSWAVIAAHLAKLQVTTNTGGEWGPRRLQLAYQKVRDGLLPAEKP